MPRWFDKPYNYVISTDGEMFSLMEHSWGDGIAGVYMKGWTNRDVQKCPSVGPDTRESHDVPAVRELSRQISFIFLPLINYVNSISDVDIFSQFTDFKLNDEVKTLVRESMQRFKEVTSKLDLQYYLYTRYGSDFIKTKKISPDALSQTAFQVGFNTPRFCSIICIELTMYLNRVVGFLFINCCYEGSKIMLMFFHGQWPKYHYVMLELS